MRAIRTRGQSLIEVLIAVAIGVVFLAGGAALIQPAIQENAQVVKVQSMTALGDGLLSDVRLWGAGDWNAVLALATTSAHHYYLDTSGSPFVAVATSSGESVTAGGTAYTRYFYVDDLYRTDSGDVTTTVGGTNTYDPSAKEITAIVAVASSTASSSTFTMYLTRHMNNVSGQTDWAGGAIGDGSPVTQLGTSYATSVDVTVNASGTLELSPPSGPTCHT